MKCLVYRRSCETNLGNPNPRESGSLLGRKKFFHVGSGIKLSTMLQAWKKIITNSNPVQIFVLNFLPTSANICSFHFTIHVKFDSNEMSSEAGLWKPKLCQILKNYSINKYNKLYSFGTFPLFFGFWITQLLICKSYTYLKTF